MTRYVFLALAAASVALAPVASADCHSRLVLGRQRQPVRQRAESVLGPVGPAGVGGVGPVAGPAGPVGVGGVGPVVGPVGPVGIGRELAPCLF